MRRDVVAEQRCLPADPQTVQDLQDAARALGSHDAVLQPAQDGGYVLIGLRRPQPRLFDAIDWGSPRVAEQTLAFADSLAG